FKQPLPNVQQFLQDISRHKYYTTMDLKSAYWQLNIHPKSQKYTASRFGRFGIFLRKRLPFGITTTPAYLIGELNKLLGEKDWIKIYMDDLTIIANSPEQMKNRLKWTLAKLKIGGLKLKPSKCEFLVTETTILNFKVLYGKIYKNAMKSALIDQK
ncbi:4134_t:CDS:1, partial [Gigaspora rosea]